MNNPLELGLEHADRATGSFRHAFLSAHLFVLSPESAHFSSLHLGAPLAMADATQAWLPVLMLSLFLGVFIVVSVSIAALANEGDKRRLAGDYRTRAEVAFDQMVEWTRQRATQEVELDAAWIRAQVHEAGSDRDIRQKAEQAVDEFANYALKRKGEAIADAFAPFKQQIAAIDELSDPEEQIRRYKNLLKQFPPVTVLYEENFDAPTD